MRRTATLQHTHHTEWPSYRVELLCCQSNESELFLFFGPSPLNFDEIKNSHVLHVPGGECQRWTTDIFRWHFVSRKEKTKKKRGERGGSQISNGWTPSNTNTHATFSDKQTTEKEFEEMLNQLLGNIDRKLDYREFRPSYCEQKPKDDLSARAV